MSYIDSKGVEHKLHADFTEGDIVVLSGDGVAFKLEEAELRKASTVFRDMLSNISTTLREVHLPESAEALAVLFMTLPSGPIIPLTAWSNTEEAIEMCNKYDAINLIKTIIHSCAGEVPTEDLLDAFATASKYQDLRSACCILGRAHQLDDMDEALMPFDKDSPWDLDMADSVRASWTVALVRAAKDMERAGKNYDKYRRDEGYWTGIIGYFAKYLSGKRLFSLRSSTKMIPFEYRIETSD